MSKRFVIIMGVLVLVALVSSACLQSSAVAPTEVPTTPPIIATPVPPTAEIPPTNTAAPDHPQASPDAARIQLNNTTMQRSPGSIEPNAAAQWVINAEEGQRMILQFTIEPASSGALSVWGADGNVLVPETQGITDWDGILPTAQDYYISMRSVAQQMVNYEFTVKLPPITPPEATRIQFQPNATSWYTPGDLAPNSTIRFVLKALGRQQMTVNLTTEPAENAAFLHIWSIDGTVYTFMAPTQTWSATLPASQDYYIEVRSVSSQNITYQLNVEIPAITSGAASSPKIAVDKPIRFATGPTSVTLDGTVISGERDRYELQLETGESMTVSITSSENNAAISILGPDGTALPGCEEGKGITNWTWENAVGGQYVILVGPTRGNATYTLSVDVN